MQEDQGIYILTWSTHLDHLKESLKEMMVSGDFADVTLVLVTDDMKELKAHQNILSSCSPFFKEILNAHSVIYLSGIKHYTIQSIMDFIYLSETQLHEENIKEFLDVAKNLDIPCKSVLTTVSSSGTRYPACPTSGGCPATRSTAAASPPSPASRPPWRRSPGPSTPRQGRLLAG